MIRGAHAQRQEPDVDRRKLRVVGDGDRHAEAAVSQLPNEIDFKYRDEFYSGLERKYSLHKTHRVFKIFRTLLEVAIGFKLIITNPTHKIANTAPKGRSETN